MTVRMHPFTESQCEFCRLPLESDDPFVGEFFDPADPHRYGSLVGHASCAHRQGWQDVREPAVTPVIAIIRCVLCGSSFKSADAFTTAEAYFEHLFRCSIEEGEEDAGSND